MSSFTAGISRSSSVSSGVVKVSPVDHSTAEEMKWLTTSGLSIVVVGASGDLAKKKTYPSLLDLYDGALLCDAIIFRLA